MFNLQRITFSFTPEEAMFVELVKACVTEKNILFERKLNMVHLEKKTKYTLLFIYT